jgi:hypothetical protein
MKHDAKATRPGSVCASLVSHGLLAIKPYAPCLVSAHHHPYAVDSYFQRLFLSYFYSKSKKIRNHKNGNKRFANRKVAQNKHTLHDTKITYRDVRITQQARGAIA